MMRAFEYKHIVGFEETNLVGNVYYSNLVRWQGRCREMFLREHAPDVLLMLINGFALVTTRVSCEFLAELFAFDEISVRMKLGALKQNRVLMHFEYWRTGENVEVVARGEQEIACMQREGKMLVPAPVPESLRQALQEFLEH